MLANGVRAFGTIWAAELTSIEAATGFDHIVYGWIFAAHMLGAAILAWVAGVIRDTAGDYAVAYITAGVLAVMAGVAALTLRRHGPALEPSPAAA